MSSLKELAILEGHRDRVWSIEWSPCGKYLISCSSDTTIRVWQCYNEESYEWMCTGILEDTHTKAVRSLTWSPNSQNIAAASFDGTVSLWQHQDNNEWEHVGLLEGHESEVKCVSWNPVRNLIATCGRDRTIWIWEIIGSYEYECVDVKHGHTQDVKMVKWHPNGNILVSCSYDNNIKLWMENVETEDWCCTQTLQEHESIVWSICFNKEGDLLFSCSDDRTIKIWIMMSDNNNISYYKLKTTISGYHHRSIYTIDFSNHLNIIVSGSGDDAIRLFSYNINHTNDSECELLVNNENSHKSDVNCVKWHPYTSSNNNHILSSAGDDNIIKLWKYIK